MKPAQRSIDAAPKDKGLMELVAHTFSGVLFAIMMEEKSWQPFAYSAYRRIQSQYLFDNGNLVRQLVQQVWIPLDQTRCLLQIPPKHLIILLSDLAKSLWMFRKGIRDIADSGACCIMASKHECLDLIYGDFLECSINAGRCMLGAFFFVVCVES